MAMIPHGLASIRLDSGRLRDVLELDQWAFPAAESVEDLLAMPSPLDWHRTHALIDPARPEELVAMHASYAFAHCPVPGGTQPVAGLTWVGVHPQWRRRGLLSAMIGEHFEHCRDRGEPISLLTASEPAIYGRFGYGLASKHLTLTLDRGATLRPVPGTEELTVRLESASPERHGDLVARLHAGVVRPGWVTQETPELAALRLSDPQLFRDGGERLRILVVERGGEPVGFALFRRKSEWGTAGPLGTVRVRSAAAADPAAARVLWSRLLDLDLTTEISPGNRPLDDPLLQLLVDFRAARAQVKDSLWARLIDLPAALAGRQYQAAVDVVLEVTDAQLPSNAGRWRLSAPAFAPAIVQASEAPADLALDIRELGAAYLGGTSLAALAAAGLVRELTPGTLLPAAAAFGWPIEPGCDWVF